MFAKLVDIIIPVYNKSKHLINLCQTLEVLPNSLFNIIFIDDGSTDDSPIIIKNAVKKINNFYFFSKSNGGVSSARNLGMEKSLSKYIWFVDPDDLIGKDLLNITEKVNKEINADVIIFDYTVCKLSENISIDVKFKEKGYYESNYFLHAYDAIISKEKNMNIIWNKWYKRDFIGKITYDERIHLGEDRLFNISIFSQRGKIFFYNKNIYEYNLYESNTLSTSLDLTKVKYIYQVNHINLKLNFFDRISCKIHILDQLKMRARLRQENLMEFYKKEHEILKIKIFPFLNFNEFILVFSLYFNLYFILIYFHDLLKKR